MEIEDVFGGIGIMILPFILIIVIINVISTKTPKEQWLEEHPNSTEEQYRAYCDSIEREHEIARYKKEMITVEVDGHLYIKGGNISGGGIVLGLAGGGMRINGYDFFHSPSCPCGWNNRKDTVYVIPVN